MTQQEQTAVVAAGGQTREAFLAIVQEKLEAQTPRIEAYLAKMHGDADRFRMTVLQAVATEPKLIACTPGSIVTAALDSAQLGLEPTGILGGAWMLPYLNRKKGIYEAKLIVGYRGYIDLLRRAGGVKSIEARVVYEGDLFEVEYGTHKKIRHVPAFMLDKEAGARRCVYWIAELEHETQFDVLEMAEIEKVRKGSKSADRGPWIDWYDAMAEKTAIRRAVSTLPISVWEARRAVQLENEAEEESAPAKVTVSPAGPTARDRAVAMLGSEEPESAAGPQEAAAATAPGEGTSAHTSDDSGARSGALGTSDDAEDGLEVADSAMDRAISRND